MDMPGSKQKCEYCDGFMDDPNHLAEKHNGGQPLTCDMCGFEDKTGEHMLEDNGVNYLLCPECMGDGVTYYENYDGPTQWDHHHYQQQQKRRMTHSIHDQLRQAALPPGYQPGKDQPHLYNDRHPGLHDFLDEVRRGMGGEPIERPEGTDDPLVPTDADLNDMAQHNDGKPLDRIFPLHTQLDDPRYVGDMMEGDPEFDQLADKEQNLLSELKNVTPNNATLSSVHDQLKRSSYGY